MCVWCVLRGCGDCYVGVVCVERVWGCVPLSVKRYQITHSHFLPLLLPSLSPSLQIIQKLRATVHLLSEGYAVSKVLSLVSEKLLRDGQELLSLKMHYLAYVVRRCQDNAGGPEGVLKM